MNGTTNNHCYSYQELHCIMYSCVCEQWSFSSLCVTDELDLLFRDDHTAKTFSNSGGSVMYQELTQFSDH